MHPGRIGLLALLVFLLPACSQKPPFSQKDFVDFYVQLQLANARYGKQPVLHKEKIDSLMHAYSLNDSLVNSIISWYGEKPDRWKMFIAQVQQRVDELKKQYVRPKRR